MTILNRIRGNPEALAILAVAILAFILALILVMPGFDKEMVKGAFAGALLGAAVSALLSLIIRFLAEPDLRGVPRSFLEAVRREVHDTGYYCRDSRFTIEVQEKGQLIFSYSSTIVPVGRGSQMYRPKVEDPEGLERLRPVEYKHNDFPKPGDAPIPLDGNTRENCEVVYDIKNDCQYPIKDEHRWRCPVEGFQLTVKLPSSEEVRN